MAVAKLAQRVAMQTTPERIQKTVNVHCDVSSRTFVAFFVIARRLCNLSLDLHSLIILKQPRLCGLLEQN